MIKLIIFDLGGVIFQTNWRKGAELFNKTIKNFKNILRRERGKYYDQYCKGIISFNKYAEFALKQLKVKANRKNKNLLKKALEIFEYPNPEILDIIENIDPQIKVCVLSNSYDVLRDYPNSLKGTKYEIHKYFNSGIFLSCDIKKIKQDKNSYEFILKNLKVKPKECIMIDNKQSYLKAAIKCGLKTHLYTKPRKLRNFLNPYIINTYDNRYNNT